jgi:hypothetical protein
MYHLIDFYYAERETCLREVLILSFPCHQMRIERMQRTHIPSFFFQDFSSSNVYTYILPSYYRYIGKLRGDTSQQRYCLYDSGLAPKNAPKQYMYDRDASVILRQQLADIYYILPHAKDGVRKMIVLLPKPSSRWAPKDENDSMLSSYNRGDMSKLLVLNRDVDDSGALWAFKPSTKNFTLLWNGWTGRQRVMAFGKVAKDQFRIMFKHPFSFVQAFALSVSACVAKRSRS